MDTILELLGGENHDLLRRIEHQLAAGFRNFARVAHHRFRVAGSDDSPRGAHRPRCDVDVTGTRHCAMVKSGNLVSMQVGVHEARRGVLPFDLDHTGGVDPNGFNRGAIVSEILADSADERRRFSQETERVRDIAAYSTTLLFQGINQKTY